MAPLTLWLRNPVRRGLLMIVVATATAGFAMAAQGNIVTNYFEHDLGLNGPEFGYITAIREIPGFLLIFLTALFYRVSLPRLTAGALVLASCFVVSELVIAAVGCSFMLRIPDNCIERW